MIEIAKGVYAIRHPNAPSGFPNGNTTVIIGDREVLVVDSCYLPSMAREDIAQIRTWTDKPVRYVINTHWHNDHVQGNGAYREAFPGAAIVAHRETKHDMDVVVRTARDRYARRNQASKQELATGKHADGSSLSEDEKNFTSRSLPVLESELSDISSVPFVSPTLTFEDTFDVDLGNRAVQVRHAGRGNTPGDVFVYLPKEKVLITGDLVVSPLPYMYDGYPSEWSKTLRALAQFDAQTIVPGHGEIMHDTAYISLLGEFIDSALTQLDARLSQIGPAEFARFEDVKSAIDLSTFRGKFAGGDKTMSEAFDAAAEHLVHAAFTEASLR